MSRPTIALSCIAKNERHNFDALFSSIKDCFDEVHITDTGSTDGSVEYLTDLVKSGRDREVLGCPLHLHYFEWIYDFAAARNYSFSHVKTDFVMWMDLDDSLVGADQFKLWRDTAMGFADYWLATYQYAFDDNGAPICSFARERVIKVSKNPIWNYFVHEGIKSTPGMTPQYAMTWSIKHRRSLSDLKNDHGRNLEIFEKNREKLDSRMVFYYGKELFEAQRPLDAYQHLIDAVSRKDLEPHDRILGIQYAVYASIACNQFDRAIDISYQGLRLDPNRAEFYSAIGDCYLKLNRMNDAIPFYYSAKNCINRSPSKAKIQGAIYNHETAYGAYPTETLAKIYYTQANFDRSEKEAKEGVEKFGSETCKAIIQEIEKAKLKISPDKSKLVNVDDIVITTQPEGAYEWDEELYKKKAMGGSETAAIEMAMWLKKKTGRNVIIFNPRKTSLIASSGVEYRPINEVLDYFSVYRPSAHIMWRHQHKLSDAPSYMWVHDLTAWMGEHECNYDKMFYLTNFHKDYMISMQGIDPSKMIATRNGLNPEKFEGLDGIEKNVNKVVFPSSPDRGLEHAIRIVELARKDLPDLELHCYYGFDNMEKFGMKDMASKLKAMILERPWVKSHGGIEQRELMRELASASVHLYPSVFIESSCIAVLESLCCGTYVLAREIGALQDTLKIPHIEGKARLLDLGVDSEEKLQLWADELVYAIGEKKWEGCKLDPKTVSWELVADQWIELMGLRGLSLVKDQDVRAV